MAYLLNECYFARSEWSRKFSAIAHKEDANTLVLKVGAGALATKAYLQAVPRFRGGLRRRRGRERGKVRFVCVHAELLYCLYSPLDVRRVVPEFSFSISIEPSILNVFQVVPPFRDAFLLLLLVRRDERMKSCCFRAFSFPS